MRRENECMKSSHKAANAESAMLYMSITVALNFPLSTMTATSKWKLVLRPHTKQLLINGSKTSPITEGIYNLQCKSTFKFR